MYSFYAGREYWDELDKRIVAAQAGSRLLVASMPIDPADSRIAQTLQHLIAAAKRGVHTHLSVDAHSFLIDDRLLGPLWWHRNLPSKLPAAFQRKLNILNAISSQPTGSIAILNKPRHRFSLPIAGRSHIKLAIVDNRIFIPSHNLECADDINIAVGFEHAAIADRLYQIMQSAGQAGSVAKALKNTDLAIPIDDETTIFIDAGVRGQSLIYEQAMQFIDEAEQQAFITCQFFPNSTTAQHLLRARTRGVDIKIVFSHPSHHGFMGGLGQQFSGLIERSRVPASMFKDGLRADQPNMHAKLITNEQGFMTGSHNYVTAGVKLGTAEIALIRKDPKAVKYATAAINKQI